MKLVPNGDCFRKAEAYKAKYKPLAALPPVKKAWSEKAATALMASAKRVVFPGVDEITAENAREMKKRVKAFAAAAPAKPGQIAQIEKLCFTTTRPRPPTPRRTSSPRSAGAWCGSASSKKRPGFPSPPLPRGGAFLLTEVCNEEALEELARTAREREETVPLRAPIHGRGVQPTAHRADGARVRRGALHRGGRRHPRARTTEGARFRLGRQVGR